MRALIEKAKFAIQRRLHKGRPIVLCYHSICAERPPFPIWTQMSADLFELHLRFLSSHFNCTPLATLVKGVETGTFDPYSVVITFDDGYRNNFTEALPLLQKYGVPATIFVTTDLIGTNRYTWSDTLASILAVAKVPALHWQDGALPLRSEQDKAIAYRTIVMQMKKLHPVEIEEQLRALQHISQVSEEELTYDELRACFGHLDWPEVDTLARSGLVEIGSHGKSHAIMSRLSAGEGREEIFGSKALLDARLAAVGGARFFAYPNGGPMDFTPANRQDLIDSKYKGCVTTNQGRISCLSDRYELTRYCIGKDCDLMSLRYLLSH